MTPDLEADVRRLIRDELRKAGVNAPEPVDPNAAQRFTIAVDGQDTTIHHKHGPAWAPNQAGSCAECLTGYPTRHRPPTADELKAIIASGQAIPPADPHAQKCAGLVHGTFGRYVSGGHSTVEVCELCGHREVKEFVNGALRTSG